jgi:hypothetical protein
MATQLRPATRDDVDFLAWAMVTAARGHLERGLWDITLDRSQQVGFRPDTEKRHPDYKATVDAPGMVRLLRVL